MNYGRIEGDGTVTIVKSSESGQFAVVGTVATQKSAKTRHVAHPTSISRACRDRSRPGRLTARPAPGSWQEDRSPAIPEY
jgi:hypothetical protein